jgi:hypothetical protein
LHDPIANGYDVRKSDFVEPGSEMKARDRCDQIRLGTPGMDKANKRTRDYSLLKNGESIQASVVAHFVFRMSSRLCVKSVWRQVIFHAKAQSKTEGAKKNFNLRALRSFFPSATFDFRLLLSVYYFRIKLHQ